jgi:hypothetical protein
MRGHRALKQGSRDAVPPRAEVEVRVTMPPVAAA